MLRLSRSAPLDQVGHADGLAGLQTGRRAGHKGTEHHLLRMVPLLPARLVLCVLMAQVHGHVHHGELRGVARALDPECDLSHAGTRPPAPGLAAVHLEPFRHPQVRLDRVVAGRIRNHGVDEHQARPRPEMHLTNPIRPGVVLKPYT